MLIGGLQKTTLIDFPGRVACTVFTVGCNFRCPFCHNKDLVTLADFKKSGITPISEEEFFEFLEKRRKILDGVAITGGEPTLQSDLPKFCKEIKNLGMEVKLDTNGSNPTMLKKLIDETLIDFVAMDVKSTFDEYQNSTKLKIKNKSPKIQIKDTKTDKNLIRNIKQSIKLILQSGLEYEFRTTVVPGIHDKKTLVKLAEQLKTLGSKFQVQSSKLSWVLQKFRPQNCLDPAFLRIEPFTDRQMQDILMAVRKILPKTRLRGA